jgi:hypothetical protein
MAGSRCRAKPTCPDGRSSLQSRRSLIQRISRRSPAIISFPRGDPCGKAIEADRWARRIVNGSVRRICVSVSRESQGW